MAETLRGTINDAVDRRFGDDDISRNKNQAAIEAGRAEMAAARERGRLRQLQEKQQQQQGQSSLGHQQQQQDDSSALSHVEPDANEDYYHPSSHAGRQGSFGEAGAMSTSTPSGGTPSSMGSTSSSGYPPVGQGTPSGVYDNGSGESGSQGGLERGKGRLGSFVKMMRHGPMSAEVMPERRDRDARLSVVNE